MYDIEYFCLNMDKLKDSFYFILTDYNKHFIRDFEYFYENQL